MKKRYIVIYEGEKLPKIDNRNFSFNTLIIFALLIDIIDKVIASGINQDIILALLNLLK